MTGAIELPDGHRGLGPQDFGIGVLFWRIREAVIVGDAASGRVVLWNPAAERLIGYSTAEAAGLPLEALVPEPLRARHLAGLARYAATARGPLVDQGIPVELPALRKTGEEIAVELTLTPLAGPSEADCFVLALIRDATERKRTEAERLRFEREQAARAAAEAAGDRLAFLAEASAVLASSLDEEAILSGVARLAVPRLADWCIVYLQEESGAIRRLPLAHADPAAGWLAEQVAREFALEPSAAEGIPKVLQTGRPELVPAATPALLAADADRPAELAALLARLSITSWMAVPLSARGRTVGALSLVAAESGRRYGPDDLALAEDLARRAALAVDNARLYREAREAIAARDRFLSMAAHELRTPVTVVKGLADLLTRPPARAPMDPQRRERLLSRIAEASQRLAALSGDLLDVSRLRLGQMPLRPAPLDLAALGRAVAERFRDALGGSHALVVDASAGDTVVVADADRVEQVLVNLLDNAAKYSPTGSPIAVSIRPEADGVLVQVRDEGIGVPPEAAEAIFEPFGRAANAAAHGAPGLGLGLHICRGIVERHGGRIWAESRGEGQGTRVSVWLPRGDPGPDEHASGDAGPTT